MTKIAITIVNINFTKSFTFTAATENRTIIKTLLSKCYPCNVQVYYHDKMTIVAKYGKTDLLVTVTCYLR